MRTRSRTHKWQDNAAAKPSGWRFKAFGVASLWSVLVSSVKYGERAVVGPVALNVSLPFLPQPPVQRDAAQVRGLRPLCSQAVRQLAAKPLHGRLRDGRQREPVRERMMGGSVWATAQRGFQPPRPLTSLSISLISQPTAIDG